MRVIVVCLLLLQIALVVGGIGLLVHLLRRQRKYLDFVVNHDANEQAQTRSILLGGDIVLGPVDPGVLCSMTTTAARLPTVHLAIESILLQSVRPRSMALYLSDAIARDALPERLTRLEALGLVIHAVPDIGPHTKLVYALRDFPALRIVTVDDDMLYPPAMLAALLASAERWPRAIVANWARRLDYDRSGLPKPVSRGRLLTPPNMTRVEQKRHDAMPSLTVYPYGTGGVLYPPGALDPRVQDRALIADLCPTEDDVWFKAMALLRRTPAVTSGLGLRPSHHTLRGTQLAALRHVNVDGLAHDSQLRATFRHFGLENVRDEAGDRSS